MITKPVTVAETILFLRQAADLWSEADHDAFITFIALNPEDGEVIPETGGVRKLRWRRQGVGKRGGVRVIYYYHDPEMPLYLLMIYAKAQQGELSPDEKRRIVELGKSLKAAHGRR